MTEGTVSIWHRYAGCSSYLRIAQQELPRTACFLLRGRQGAGCDCWLLFGKRKAQWDLSEQRRRQAAARTLEAGLRAMMACSLFTHSIWWHRSLQCANSMRKKSRSLMRRSSIEIGVRVSTHAKNKKVLCVRLWKGTCFCRRVLLLLSFFLSSLTQIRALKSKFKKEKVMFLEGARGSPGALQGGKNDKKNEKMKKKKEGALTPIRKLRGNGIWNVLLNIATKYHSGARIELRLTEEDLGQVGLSCHYTLACLCEYWCAF